MKAGRDHKVPLSDSSLALLKSMKKIGMATLYFRRKRKEATLEHGLPRGA